MNMPAVSPSEALTRPSGLPVEPGLPQTTQAAPTPVIDDAAVQALGARMKTKFSAFVTARRMAEMKWMQSARQFLGIYDPDVQIPNDRSKAYPKMTRVKVVSMVSRLMNLLFPTSEKNWTLAASPVPNLPPQVMQEVLNRAYAEVTQEQDVELTDEIVAGYVQREAAARAAALEKEIDDQLAEIGGGRSRDYIALCRQVIYSAVTYGSGIVRGPFVRSQIQSRWARNAAGEFEIVQTDVKRPQYEFVPLWDYYPDMAAKSFDSQEGWFIRHVMSRHQLRKLADDPNFMSDRIKQYLRDHATGNYVRQSYEAELKAMGVNANVNEQNGSRYEVLEWNGHIPAADLVACGVVVPEDQMADDIEAVLWIVDNEVIRAEINPWVELVPGRKVDTIHQFVFEEDETSILGNGLPNIMRDSQMGVCIATRMLFDNAAVTCGPVLEMNTDLVRLDQDVQNIAGFRIFYREGTGADAGVPAIRNLEINGHIPELKSVIEMFQSFADTETFVGPQTGGDMQRAPSEPMRTAAGASMLRGDAALPFKDVIRNFDRFTQSLLTSLLVFNEQFGTRPELIGDAQVVPRGASSLMAKEMRGIALDQMAQLLTPEERAYLRGYQFVKERLAVRDVDLASVLVSEDEAKQIEARQAETAAAQSQQAQQMAQAEMRKLLADAMKAITQSDKNAAAADVARANAVLDALERGVAHEPTGQTSQTAGPAQNSPQGG